MAKKSKNVPDDRDIYLAFSTVFTGPNSEVRKQSVIKKLVQSSEKRQEVAQFFKQNNHDAVRDVVYDKLKVLLEQQVFKSHRHAKVKFPDLFAASPTQTVERAASQVEAAIDHARAIEEALQGDQVIVDNTANESDETCTRPEVTHQEVTHPVSSSALPTLEGSAHPQLSSGLVVPSLFPLRLPFLTGHKIISEVQTILERACFDFAKHAWPEILADRGWDCAEAVELNIWVGVLRRQEERLSRGCSVANQELNSSFYKSISDIRHTAVHRLPMTAAAIEKSLRDGEILATLLTDEAVAGKLSEMRSELQRVTAEMADHKCMLEAKLTRTLERIAAERAELDRQETEAMDGMVQADKEYQLFAGASLEQKLAGPEADVMTAKDSSTDDDDVDDTVDAGTSEVGKAVDGFRDLNILWALGIPSVVG